MTAVVHLATNVLRGARRRGTLRRLLFVDVVALVASAWWLTNLGQYLPRTADQFEQLRFQVTIPLSAFLLFLVVPLSAVAIERDIGAGVIQTLLAHPFGRGRYVIGQWAGLTALIGLNAALVLALTASAGLAIPGYAPRNVLPVVAYEGAAIAAGVALVLFLASAFGRFSAFSGTLLITLGAAYLSASPSVPADLRALTALVVPIWSVWSGLAAAIAPAGAASLWLGGPGAEHLIAAGVWVVVLLGATTIVFDRTDL